MKIIVAVFVVTAMFGTAQLAAKPRNADGLPSLTFTVAVDYPDKLPAKGPLAQRAEAALGAAAENATAFRSQISSGIKVSLRKAETVPSARNLFLAAKVSCHGPFLYDQGSDWVQFSWICDPASQAPLAKFLKFENSPELNMTLWFEKGKINRIDAGEPLMIPFQPIVSMNAYDVMKSER